MQGSLIAVKVDVNNEVNIVVRVKGQDTDVMVIDDVKLQSKSKLWQSLVDIGGDIGVVVL